VPEKNIKGGAIITADYIEYGNTKYVATAQNNNAINFWDANNYMWRERLNTSEIQLCLKWCGSGVNRLFSAGMDFN
jgi:WD40 repeat protein